MTAQVYRAIQVFVGDLLLKSLTKIGPAKSTPVDVNGGCRCARNSGSGGNTGNE